MTEAIIVLGALALFVGVIWLAAKAMGRQEAATERFEGNEEARKDADKKLDDIKRDPDLDSRVDKL